MTVALARPTVFVVQEGPHDYGPALDYGELDILFKGEITSAPVGVSPRNQGLLAEVYGRLASYIPGHDYVLLAGSPVAIAWVCFLLGERHPQACHNFLKWDTQLRRYLPYVIDRTAAQQP
jgi:hypothetical protein